MISADFQPLFINPNDKLSAHKVVSIALEISVPEYKNVDVFGTNTNLYAKGIYEDLNITLSDGRCNLENVSESVEVTTQKGDILLAAPSGNITAESVYGKVKGNNPLWLQSICSEDNRRGYLPHENKIISIFLQSF